MGRQALTLLLASTCLCGGCSFSSPPKLHAGEEMVAVDPAHILEVSYRSQAHRMIAHRWNLTEPFEVTFEKLEGKTFERCTAPETFPDVLRTITIIRVKSVLQQREARQLMESNPIGHWAELNIRDNTNLEPIYIRLLSSAKPTDETFARRDEFPEIVTIHGRVLELASMGCRGLKTLSSSR